MTIKLPSAVLTKMQVCARLAMSERTLEEMVRKGKFPPSVRMGKRVFWSEAALDNWALRMFGPQEAWRPA